MPHTIHYNLYHHLKTYCLILFLFLLGARASAQLTISGTVYDNSKTVPIKSVVVKSSTGIMTVTDSVGHYNIVATDKDSLTFIYLNKSTPKFAVKKIDDIGNFDISLHINMPEKFKTLKEVRVFSKSFREDSITNRNEYSKYFNFQKPGISTTRSEYGGGAGLDLDEFINIFRFKRNKRLKYMQTRVLEQEQENYINYRFNKSTVKRITHLEGEDLDKFMLRYRPDFDFTQTSSTVTFYQYILNSSYKFKREKLIEEGQKEVK